MPITGCWAANSYFDASSRGETPADPVAHRPFQDENRSPFTFSHIGFFMHIHLGLTPLISLIAGILVLLMPKLLNFIVAMYLIAVGLVGLLGLGALHIS